MLVSEELGNGLDVGREACETKVHLGAVGEDLGKVVADSEGLEAEAQIAGDGDAVLADHGNAGTAVLGLISYCELWYQCWRCVLMEKGELMVDEVMWCLAL